MDRYQRIRKIGEGAFGKAILVRHKQTNRQCVVKEINIVKMQPKEREDARKEVAVLAQLKHPNIVTYIESFEEAGTLYILMNYCAGGDLYSKINGQRGVLFQEDQILMWFAQICLAIKHIHDRKILHRDIKSQNIFLTTSGAVQLGDFGIAKVLNNTVELARTCIGTPYYLSPEIVENKPYNNKSDIWSLGCVLYELTTLKHAFEAGNMKNLVLKIIRGSYPPIPPQYSYDLRGLIAQLFKRAPRDRPSINSVLKKNFIMERVRHVMSAEQIADEFNHTILHGAKMAKALPPAPRPSSAPKKSVTPRPGSAGGQKYNPANVYGVPIGRKSGGNRSSSDLKKKPPPPANRPVLIPGQQQEEQIARRHKDLVEKQKMDRINKSKEEGWRNLVDSLESDKDEPKQPSPRPEPRPLPMPKQHPGPAQPNYLENRAAREPGKYDEYLAYLDKLKNQRQEREKELDQRAGVYMQAPQPVAMLNRPGGGNANNQAPAAQAVQQANYDRQMGSQAAERAKIVEDYQQRRREAAMNKARGQAELYGRRTPSAGARRSPVPPPRQQKPIQGRNQEELEYLEKLRQIREQNIKERQALQQKQKADVAQKDADERRKKSEALKGRPPSANGSRPNSAAAKVNMKPAAAMPITGVLHVIGVGDKAAPPAADGQATPPSEDSQQATVQQKKSEILKRLNEKTPGRSKWGGDKDEVTPTEDKGEGRSKWGEGAVSPLAVTQPDTPEPESARSQWDKDKKLRLSDLPLEQTASQMEATSARDNVVRNPGDPKSARNQWGRPGSTIVKALDKLPVYDGTVTLDSGGSQERGETTTPSSTPQPAIGSTLTLSKAPIPSPTPSVKPPIRSTTLVIKEADTPATTTSAAAGRTTTSTTTSAAASTTTITAARLLSVEKLGVVGGTGNVTATVCNPSRGPNYASTQPAQNAELLIGESELPGSSRSFQSHEAPTNQEEAELASSEKLHTVPEVSEDFTETGRSVVKENAAQNEQKDENDAGEKSPPNTGKEPEQPNVASSENDVNGEVTQKPASEEKPVVSKEKLISPKEKPPVPKKPDVLPKPVLLPKPDKPYMFSDEVPVIVASENKDNKAFNKSGEKSPSTEEKEKNTGEEEDRSRSVQKGLCTGNFDMHNVQMLRTCSEPDLTRLFRSAARTVQATLRRHQSLDLSQELDAEKRESIEEDEVLSPSSSTEEKDSNTNAADDGDDDNDDDEDLMSMRATMQSLLLDEDENGGSDDDGVTSPKIKFSLSSDTESTIKKAGSGDKDKEEEGDNKEESSDNAPKKKGGGDSEHIVKSKSDSVLDKKHQDENGDEDVNDDEEEENLNYDEAELLGLNDSDEETVFGDDDEGEDLDLFSRLEQQRADLEKELGFDKFIEIYKTVQVLQEDEDENMEEGARIAIQMLGQAKQHLYPRIFQLVMADTAFTEDNV